MENETTKRRSFLVIYNDFCVRLFASLCAIKRENVLLLRSKVLLQLVSLFIGLGDNLILILSRS